MIGRNQTALFLHCWFRQRIKKKMGGSGCGGQPKFYSTKCTLAYLTRIEMEKQKMGEFEYQRWKAEQWFYRQAGSRRAVERKKHSQKHKKYIKTKIKQKDGTGFDQIGIWPVRALSAQCRNTSTDSSERVSYKLTIARGRRYLENKQTRRFISHVCSGKLYYLASFRHCTCDPCDEWEK